MGFFFTECLIDINTSYVMEHKECDIFFVSFFTV